MTPKKSSLISFQLSSQISFTSNVSRAALVALMDHRPRRPVRREEAHIQCGRTREAFTQPAEPAKPENFYRLSREGRRFLGGHFDPNVFRQIKLLAIEATVFTHPGIYSKVRVL